MKRALFIVLLLAAAGIALSFLVIPDDNEVSLLVYKEQIDERYPEVEANYRKRLESGEVTPEVVSTLKNLYLKSAQVDKAVEVMEIFVKENPTNLEARKEMGRLYQMANRMDAYLKNLEEISKLESNQEVLKTLADIYNFNQEYDKQAEVLKRMLETGEQLNAKQFIDLANILAAEQKTDEAIKVLEDLHNSETVEMNYNSVELLTNLYCDAGRTEDAYKLAKEWQDKNVGNDSDKANAEMARLISIIHYKASPVLAQKLLEPYGDKIYKSRDLFHEQVMVLLSTGRDDEAFKLLTWQYEGGALSDDLLDSYIILALKRGDYKLAEELADTIRPERITEGQAITLTELAIDNRRKKLLNKIEERLGIPSYLEANRLFAIVLKLATKDKGADKAIEEYCSSDSVSDAHMLTIARNCARAGKYSCTRKLLSRVILDENGKEKENLSAAKVAAVGNLYIDIKQFKDGINFLNKYRVKDSSVEVERVWVKLAAATGDDNGVIEWLERNKNLQTESLMRDLYFLSMDGRNYELASIIANSLYNYDTNSSTYRSYLANAYLKAGEFSKALNLFESAGGTLSDEDADNYLAALIYQASRDPSYRYELGNFAKSQLQSRRLSENRRMAIIYALINAKRFDIAMPYVKEYAYKYGGDWVYMYAENLEKQGKYEAAKEFWLKLAQSPKTSDEEKRNIAFSLVSKGYYSDAVRLFKELSENKPADSTEVQQLLYLWGPRLNDEQLSWLWERAKAAKPAIGIVGSETKHAEYRKWLSYISDYSSASGFIEFVDNNSTEEIVYNRYLINKYLTSLYKLRHYDDIRAFITRLSSEHKSPELVRQYARFLNDYSFNREAKSAYMLLSDIIPNDREALREVGIASYNSADYSNAKKYLKKFIDGNEEEFDIADDRAYLAYFYYAQILRANNYRKEANKYYDTVIRLVSSETDVTADMESKLAQSLAYSGNEESGFAWFRDAVAKYPNNRVLRADMIFTFIETKHYNEARKLLDDEYYYNVVHNSPLEEEKDIKKETRLDVTDDNIAVEPTPFKIDGEEQKFLAYRLLDNRSELLLAINPEAKLPENFEAELMKKHKWISYVNRGYDKMLIAVKDGWQVEAVKGRNEGVIIVPSKVDASSSLASNFESQLHLNYELLKARLELEDGNPHKAVEELNKLAPLYSEDSQYLGYLANAENYIGNWVRALKLLNKAESIAPDNEDISRLKRSIERTYAQHIKIDHEWRGLGDHNEQITTLSGFARVSGNIDVGAVLQNNKLDTAELQRSTGVIDNYNAERQRGEIFIRHTDDNSNQLKLSLFANNDTIGAGIYYSLMKWAGRTSAAIEWRRPYWEFVEGVLDDATRDRVALSHERRISSKTVVSGAIGLNRYNVEDVDDVATSLSVDASVSHNIYNQDNKELYLVYGLDAEYENDHKERTDILGRSYRLFPFRSREVHSLAIAGKYDITRRTYVDGLIGYAYDRLGGHGPLAEGRFTHEINDALEFQARAYIGIGRGETDDDLKRVGAYLMYRY